jgi:hypothetical protein
MVTVLLEGLSAAHAVPVTTVAASSKDPTNARCLEKIVLMKLPLPEK